MAKANPIPKEDQEWRARDDLNILRQADEIRKDKKRLAAAEAMAKKEMKALEQISSLGK